MEPATFRGWLEQRGCRFDNREHQERGHGQAVVTVHREGRTARLPLGGSRKALDLATEQAVCDALTLIGGTCLARSSSPEGGRNGYRIGRVRRDRSGVERLGAFNALATSAATASPPRGLQRLPQLCAGFGPIVRGRRHGCARSRRGQPT